MGIDTFAFCINKVVVYRIPGYPSGYHLGCSAQDPGKFRLISFPEVVN